MGTLAVVTAEPDVVTGDRATVSHSAATKPTNTDFQLWLCYSTHRNCSLARNINIYKVEAMKLNTSMNFCSCCYGRSMRLPNFLSLEQSKLAKGVYQFSSSSASKSCIRWHKPTGSHFTSLGKKKKFAKKQSS